LGSGAQCELVTKAADIAPLERANRQDATLRWHGPGAQSEGQKEMQPCVGS